MYKIIVIDNIIEADSHRIFLERPSPPLQSDFEIMKSRYASLIYDWFKATLHFVDRREYVQTKSTSHKHAPPR